MATYLSNIQLAMQRVDLGCKTDDATHHALTIMFPWIATLSNAEPYHQTPWTTQVARLTILAALAVLAARWRGLWRQRAAWRGINQWQLAANITALTGFWRCRWSFSCRSRHTSALLDYKSEPLALEDEEEAPVVAAEPVDLTYFVEPTQWKEGDLPDAGDDRRETSIDGVRLITDQNGSGARGDRALGCTYMPEPIDKVLTANGAAGVAEAIKERIDKKQVAPTMSDTDQKEMRGLTDKFLEIMNRPSEKRLLHEMTTTLLFGNYKSKKWTEARALSQLQALHRKYNPTYQFSAAVKIEPLKKGKPPRMIIADGDSGQVMAWALLGVLERWVFHRYKGRSIKGKEKSERMQDLPASLRHFVPGIAGDTTVREAATILENDGSAWDTCMSLFLRSLQENPLMEGLESIVGEYITDLSHYTTTRLESNKLTKLNMRVKPNINIFDEIQHEDAEKAASIGKDWRACIVSIRRSGCRGTSILNWIANFLCWTWVLFGPLGAKLLEFNGIKAVDVFGITRRILMCFEGDDSILAITGPAITEAQRLVLEERWAKLGHRPKLFVRRPGEAAEFCGYKFIVDEYGLVDGSECPDLPRMMSNAPYTTCRAAVAAAESKDHRTFAKCVVPGILSRAFQLTNKVPTVAKYLVERASEIAMRGGVAIRDFEYTSEELHRLEEFESFQLPELWKGEYAAEKMLEVPIKRWQTMECKVMAALSAGLANSCAAEADLCIAHGWVTDQSQWNALCHTLSNVRCGTLNAEFRANLPPAFL